MIIQEISRESDPKTFHVYFGNCGEYYCYTQIYQEMMQRLNLMTAKHSKVLFVRFDLTLPSVNGNNSQNNLERNENEIAVFFELLEDDLLALAIDVQYVWVRDQSETSDHQLYHCMLLLNGEILQQQYSLPERISAIWSRALDCKTGEYVNNQAQAIDSLNAEALVDYCKRDCFGRPVGKGILILRPSIDSSGEVLKQQRFEFDYAYTRCLSWASFMSKATSANQANQAPCSMKRYGMSRIEQEDLWAYLSDDQKVA